MLGFSPKHHVICQVWFLKTCFFSKVKITIETQLNKFKETLMRQKMAISKVNPSDSTRNQQQLHSPG